MHVGSNCVLVAPVTIGAGGTVGGGSVVEQGSRARGAHGERGRGADRASRTGLGSRTEEAQGLSRLASGRLAGIGSRVSNFARLTVKKAFTLRTLASAREEALRQRLVPRHVAARSPPARSRGRARRASTAAPRRRRSRVASKASRRVGVLPVERDLDQRLQSRGRAQRGASGDRMATWRSITPAARSRFTRRRQVSVARCWWSAARCWFDLRGVVLPAASSTLQVGGVQAHVFLDSTITGEILLKYFIHI